MKLHRRSIVWSLLLCAGLATTASATPDDAERDRLKAQLEKNLQALQAAAVTVAQCSDVTNCELRLWISEPFIATTLAHLLSNRSVTAIQTGAVPPFLDGGDALGCGWNVNVGGFSAALALETVNASWAHIGDRAELVLSPNFSFGAKAQVSGRVNGPPGPCSLFRWSCDCPIGGGIGASVGVSASMRDVLPLIVSFQPSSHQLLVVVRQPAAKKLTVNASIGLGLLGAIRFRIPLELSQIELYRREVPLAFGTSGVLKIDGQTKPYTLAFTLNGPLAEHGGLALRSKVTVNWMP